MSNLDSSSTPRDDAALKKLADLLAAAPLAGADQLLPQMIGAAAAGEDVARRYPRFFQAMLADPHLQEAFLAGLDALTLAPPGAVGRPPLPHSSPPPPTVWPLAWTWSTALLADLFARADQPAVTVRSIGADDLVLLRQQITIDAETWSALVRLVDEPAMTDFVALQIWLAPDQPSSDRPVLTAAIRWNDFAGAVTLSDQGEGRLLVPLEAIQTEATGTAPLQLTVRRQGLDADAAPTGA